MVTSLGMLGEGVGLGLGVRSGMFDALKSCVMPARFLSMKQTNQLTGKRRTPGSPHLLGAVPRKGPDQLKARQAPWPPHPRRRATRGVGTGR